MKPTTHTCKGCKRTVDRLYLVTKASGGGVFFPCWQCFANGAVKMLRGKGLL